MQIERRRNAVPAAAVFVCALFAASGVRAAPSGQGLIVISLVNPVTLAKTDDLDFGRISSGVSGGTVVVSPIGERVVTGDVVVQGGTVTAASFDVSGHHLLSYGIVLPTSVTVSSGADTMSIDGFTTDKPGNVGTLPGGADSFRIGATLNVGPSQATGSYTGTFDVSVAYQ